MSTLREVSHIAKFNGQNFPLWKFGCWLLLEQHQLVKIVNGQERLPVETLNADRVVTNAEVRARWQERDILARNYLVATIETQQQRALVNCNTAHEMWMRISAQHLRNAVENQHVRNNPSQQTTTRSGRRITTPAHLRDYCLGGPR
ncbi:hypothetical protein DAPPUDRAFT_335496 [Daphnia pulex]|uniref:Uncharacterized protein n=1 Tax=Daphnia pulex TaxID=6669 RepID=E9HXW6_DAPPU|nr:hypothetical protein DAPPUDRAFT_335496 [Daphnia pulex]|eukprot:EFX63412.1 hypothetical protein DAPPUDRAFT_335496 [Daphnia pulex]